MKRTSIVSFVATAVMLPFLVSVASEAAKPHLPGAFSRATQWTTSVIEWSWTPWIFAGVAGVLVGLWLDRVLSAMDGRNPITKNGKAANLAPMVRSIATECELALSPETAGHINANTLRAQIYIMGEKLKRLGLADPHLPEGASTWVLFHNVSAMLRAIEPAMREGNLVAARKLALLVREGQQRNPTKEPPPPYSW